MFYDAAMEASSTKEQANETQFKARIRKTLAIIMDTWQAGHYIEKWTPLKVGNQYNSFRIYFPKNAPPALPEADQTRLNHLSEFL